MTFAKQEQFGMLRIDKTAKKLVPLTKSTLADAEHWERQLEDMICAEPDAFLGEIGEESLWIIGKEVRPSEAVPDRIDILALDEDGTAVVAELKRGTHKLHLLQAVTYAGMVSHWTAERFVETLAANYHNQSLDAARAAIEDHVDPNASINNAQRILLIAEKFDPAVLIATEWLHEKFGVDVRCYQLRLCQENANDYLTCTCVYPPPEIATLTRGGERTTVARSEPTDWQTALSTVANADVRQFFTSELAHGQENRMRYRELVYRIDGKRRYWVTCRTDYGYVRQKGRFADDEAYWGGLISKPSSIGKRHWQQGGASLRFHLATAADFAAFKKALEGDIKTVEFSKEPDEPSAENDD